MFVLCRAESRIIWFMNKSLTWGSVCFCSSRDFAMGTAGSGPAITADIKPSQHTHGWCHQMDCMYPGHASLSLLLADSRPYIALSFLLRQVLAVSSWSWICYFIQVILQAQPLIQKDYKHTTICGFYHSLYFNENHTISLNIKPFLKIRDGCQRYMWKL